MAHSAGGLPGVFDRAAATYDTVIPFFTRFGARLVALADLSPGERVLDVGCGRGATLFPAAAHVAPGGSVLGVDLSATMVAMLGDDIERRGVANASVRSMDAQALEVDQGSFDVVMASFVLHLLPDPGAGVASVFTALRGGGRCAAAVPAGSGPEWDFLGALFSSFAARSRPTMGRPYRQDFDLARGMAVAGFDVVSDSVEQIEFFFADEEAWWAWIWSSGLRATLDILPPDDREELRCQAFVEAAALRTPDGIPLRQQARFVIAHKPERA